MIVLSCLSNNIVLERSRKKRDVYMLHYFVFFDDLCTS